MEILPKKKKFANLYAQVKHHHVFDMMNMINFLYTNRKLGPAPVSAYVQKLWKVTENYVWVLSSVGVRSPTKRHLKKTPKPMRSLLPEHMESCLVLMNQKGFKNETAHEISLSFLTCIVLNMRDLTKGLHK